MNDVVVGPHHDRIAMCAAPVNERDHGAASRGGAIGLQAYVSNYVMEWKTAGKAAAVRQPNSLVFILPFSCMCVCPSS
jgi:hypothetical protein